MQCCFNSLGSHSSMQESVPIQGRIRFPNSNSFANGPSFALGTQFTVEFWANISAPGNGSFQGYFSTDQWSFGWDFQGDGKWSLVRGGTSSFTSTTSACNAKLGWQYVCIQRNTSNIITIYIDGVLCYTSPSAVTFTASGLWSLGKSSRTGSAGFIQNNGAITRLRISNIQRYTGNFNIDMYNKQVPRDGNTFECYNFSSNTTPNNWLVGYTGANGLTVTNAVWASGFP